MHILRRYESISLVLEFINWFIVRHPFLIGIILNDFLKWNFIEKNDIFVPWSFLRGIWSLTTWKIDQSNERNRTVLFRSLKHFGSLIQILDHNSKLILRFPPGKSHVMWLARKTKKKLSWPLLLTLKTQL